MDLMKHADGPRFIAGKFYRWSVNDRGNLSLSRWEDDE